MPRALFVRPEGSPFGIRLARVLHTFVEEGWACDVLHAEGSLGRADPTATGRDLRAAVSLHEFPVPRTRMRRALGVLSGSGYFGTKELRESLSRLLTAHAYRVIVVKDSPALGSVFRVLNRLGKATVPVVCEMVEPRVAQAYDSLVRYGTWSSRLAAHARGILPRLRRVERRLLPKCDRVFVVCDEMRDWLLANYPIRRDRISVVQNVEILDVFDATRSDGVPPRRHARVSFVGTMGPHRGVELLIAVAGLVRRRSSAAFSLAVVGGSRDESRRLARLCQEHGIADIAELEPHVPHARAMQWIKETDIGVIPHADTPGIRTTVPFKLFQYMAAGAACLVSDVGPLGRIVRESRSGLVARAGSVEDLAQNLTWLLEHPESAKEMGRQGRRRSEDEFRWEIESREYSRYLASLESRAYPQ